MQTRLRDQECPRPLNPGSDYRLFDEVLDDITMAGILCLTSGTTRARTAEAHPQPAGRPPLPDACFGSARWIAPTEETEIPPCPLRTRRQSGPEFLAWPKRVLAIDAETAALSPRSPRSRAGVKPGSRSAPITVPVPPPQTRAETGAVNSCRLGSSLLLAITAELLAIWSFRIPGHELLEGGMGDAAIALAASPFSARAWPPCARPLQHQCTDGVAVTGAFLDRPFPRRRHGEALLFAVAEAM